MSGGHRSYVCRCEDIDLAEVHEAIEEGYSDLESLRRFTALGTGPCQGKACLSECIRILAEHHDVPEQEVGLMTLRPPIMPIPLGLLAALPDDVVEGLLEGEEARAAARARRALDDADAVRTGRATPDSVAREKARHAERRRKAEAGP